MTSKLSMAALIALAGTAHGQVIITEVFYNPSGEEAESEWVEVFNAGSTPVDITNYALDDEDGSTPSHAFGAGAVRLPDGTILDASADPECVDVSLFEGGAFVCDTANQIIIQPGEAIVVGSFWDRRSSVGGDATNDRANTFEAFVASWGEDTDGDGVGDTFNSRVILLLSTATIANTASDTNEVLDLVELDFDSGTFASRDLVNYEVGNASNQWPFSSNGRSIYLQPNFYPQAGAETLPGEAWALSITDRDGAYEGRFVEGISLDDSTVTFTLYGESDVASPGIVPGLAQSFEDANGNGRDDALDIFLGTSLDCNRNRIPDEVEPDCNGNGIPDGCEFQINQEDDCDGDGQPDDCQIANDPSLDLDGNGFLDVCDSINGFGTVVISEIMFNPSGSEDEFVEIINTGDAPVDVAGWFLQDLDQPAFDGVDAVIPAEDDTDGDGEPDAFILQPGEILVIGEEDLGDWEGGWGPVNGYRYVDPAGSLGLGNNADLVNEVRALLAPGPDGENIRIDVANYQSTTSNGVPQGGWPGDDGRGSFYALGSSVDADANNDGGNWVLSIRGVDGARSPENTAQNGGAFDGRDAGSPGFVNLGPAGRPVGDVIISEIHFATNSDFPGLPFPDETNGIDEWVEILNVSGQAIDISGWFLEDEDGRTQSIPAGATLAPGEAAILTGWDFPSENPTPVSEYYAAWDCGYQVFALNNWYDDGDGPGLDRLGDAAEGGTGTNPSTGREILTLRAADDSVQDVVNYDDDGFVWPLVSNGLPFTFAFSIYLFNDADLNELDNDAGLNWATSLSGFDGAIQNNLTTVYNAPAFGSPGFVDGVTTNFDSGNCISPDPIIPFCADQNGDGEVNGTDFGAWLANFNVLSPVADVNQDGNVNGLDFGAWLNAFNQGNNGPICE